MMSSEHGAILTRYRQVLAEIEQAAHSVDRDPESIKLVVVTKGHPIQAVKEALASGLRVFGENYVQEGITKMKACSDQIGVEWHMIGHVQSRKAQPVCEHYSWVHSLDRIKLANRLDRFAGQIGRKLPVLLECNVSGEESKYGWPAWEEQSWINLADSISQLLRLSNLDVRGLMTMAPFLPQAEQARPYFQRLRRLRDFLALQFPQNNWHELSMGMSADFQVAVQEGATIVRIGTAIMGPRPD
jgi:pyridoxal phosphate enzyme (YggS family)